MSLRAHEHSTIKEYRARALGEVAQMLAQVGEHKAATEAARQALAAAEANGDKGDKARALGGVTQALAQIDEPAQARAALAMAFKTGRLPGRQSVLEVLEQAAPTLAGIDEGMTLRRVYEEVAAIESLWGRWSYATWQWLRNEVLMPAGFDDLKLYKTLSLAQVGGDDARGIIVDPLIADFRSLLDFDGNPNLELVTEGPTTSFEVSRQDSPERDPMHVESLQCTPALGAPDFFLWHPEHARRLWFFAEVKHPKDHLRESRYWWIHSN